MQALSCPGRGHLCHISLAKLTIKVSNVFETLLYIWPGFHMPGIRGFKTIGQLDAKLFQGYMTEVAPARGQDNVLNFIH